MCSYGTGTAYSLGSLIEIRSAKFNCNLSITVILLRFKCTYANGKPAVTVVQHLYSNVADWEASCSTVVSPRFLCFTFAVTHRCFGEELLPPIGIGFRKAFKIRGNHGPNWTVTRPRRERHRAIWTDA